MNEVLGINAGNNNGDDTNEVAYIEQNFGDIQAIGIALEPQYLAILDQIEGEAHGSGFADNAETTEAFTNILASLNPLSDLAEAGGDVIEGGEGHDLIFGDVLYTDQLAIDQGLSLPEGTGWQVFAELEQNNPTWDRQTTIEYIQNHSDELAGESDLNGEFRQGGNDILRGGGGNDTIYGQEGDDTINGGKGENTLSGGSGNNTFEFDMLDLDADTVNTIIDFDITKDALSFVNVNDANDMVQSIDSINNTDLQLTMNNGAQIIIEDYGSIPPGATGLGDLPGLDAQVDVI